MLAFALYTLSSIFSFLIGCEFYKSKDGYLRWLTAHLFFTYSIGLGFRAISFLFKTETLIQIYDFWGVLSVLLTTVATIVYYIYIKVFFNNK